MKKLNISQMEVTSGGGHLLDDIRCSFGGGLVGAIYGGLIGGPVGFVAGLLISSVLSTACSAGVRLED
jgi:hypothetical protein